MEVFELYTRLFATVIEGNSSNNLPYTVLRNLDSIAQKLVDVTKDCTVKNLKHYNHSVVMHELEKSVNCKGKKWNANSSIHRMVVLRGEASTCQCNNGSVEVPLMMVMTPLSRL
ncbi:hypothetical protein HKD37_02G005156 [Glycine soja]